MPEDNVQLAMIDGRDALLMVLVKPGSDDGMITVDAHCNGLDKLQAAKILMHVARQWKAAADAAAGSALRTAPTLTTKRTPTTRFGDTNHE